MTAVSAPSAFGTPSNGGDARTVLLPGSPATYANRATLREMGLRWDPAGHRWHGTTTTQAVKTLREHPHLEVRVFGVLEGSPKGPPVPKPAPLRPVPLRITTQPNPRDPPRDYTRSRFESRLAFPGVDDGEDANGVATPTRRFSLWETTSGLPDDSREEDEKAAERQLRDFRARVKRARAIVASTPGLSETLHGDWQRAARFYVRFGITEAMLRAGVPCLLQDETCTEPHDRTPCTRTQIEPAREE